MTVIRLALLLTLTLSAPAFAQKAKGDAKEIPPAAAIEEKPAPYDERLERLSEILGAVHYLRELCGADEGQLWRDRMRDLIDAEGSSALRRARLPRRFNQGYQGYSRTYRTCTSSAQTAINRFLGEATQLADGLIRDVP
jgi:uncharacterized protein (TIGR02301 family)